MPRKVFAVERSPLARNVYSMILSKLGSIRICSNEGEGLIDEVKRLSSDTDLLLVNYNAIKDNKQEFYQIINGLFAKVPVPCVFFVSADSKSECREFEKMKNVTVIERPFFPDDFLKTVEGYWRQK